MFFEDKAFIARCIRNARQKEGLTQLELAEKIDISAQQVSRIETASYVPSLQTFLKIVVALNLKLEDFGIKIKSDRNNSKRDEIIKLLYTVGTSDLNLYYAILKDIVEHRNL